MIQHTLRQGEELRVIWLDIGPSRLCNVSRPDWNVVLPDWEWELSHSCFQVAMVSSRTSTAAFESLAFLATSRAGEER